MKTRYKVYKLKHVEFLNPNESNGVVLEEIEFNVFGFDSKGEALAEINKKQEDLKRVELCILPIITID